MSANPTSPVAVEDLPTVRLITADGSWSCVLPQPYAIVCGFIAQKLDQDATKTEFVVSCNRQVLQRITRYLEFHRGTEPRVIEPPLRSRRLTELCEHTWDADFIDDCYSAGLLQPVATTSLQLQLHSLVNLSCAKTASLIKSHPLDKVKSVLLGGVTTGYPTTPHINSLGGTGPTGGAPGNAQQPQIAAQIPPSGAPVGIEDVPGSAVAPSPAPVEQATPAENPNEKK